MTSENALGVLFISAEGDWIDMSDGSDEKTKGLWLIAIVNKALSHPLRMIITSTIAFIAVEIGVLWSAAFPFDHGDDIIDYTWGILLSVIATSVTAYVFMYESNRSTKTKVNYSAKISSFYEKKIRTMLTCIAVLTIIIVIAGMLLFTPFINHDHAAHVGWMYAIVTGFSISIISCNLIVMLAIIQSGKVISKMALDDDAKESVPSLMDKVTHTYSNDPYFRVLAHSESSEKGFKNGTANMNEYSRKVAPLSQMLNEIVRVHKLDDGSFSMRDALQSGIDTIRGRISSSRLVDRSIGQYYDINGEFRLKGPEKDAKIIESAIPRKNDADNDESRIRVMAFISDRIRVTVKANGVEAELKNGLNSIHGGDVEFIVSYDVNLPGSADEKKEAKLIINGEEVDKNESGRRIKNITDLSVVEATFQSGSSYLYDVWTRDYILTDWLFSDKCNDMLDSIISEMESHVSINNMVMTIMYYNDLKNELKKENLKYPYSSIAVRKMMHNKTLCNIDFTGSDLKWTSFYGSDMTSCNFTSCNLTGSDMSNAILKNTIWQETTIDDEGILLNGSDLTGATIGRVNLNENADIGGCIINGSTINNPVLTETYAISVLMNNVLINYGRFFDCLIDDSTFEKTIFHENFISTSINNGLSLRFGNIAATTLEPLKARFRLVKEGVLLYDSGKIIPIEIISEVKDINKKLTGGEKHSVKVSTAICSLFNIETDWEYRPAYNAELDFSDDTLTMALTRIVNDPNESRVKLFICSPKIFEDKEGDEQDSGNEKKKEQQFGCDFEGSQFNDSRIWNSRVECANMRNLDMRDCSFFGSNFFNTSFDQSRFEKIDMSNSVSVRGQYLGCSFDSTKFYDADIENCDFIECNLDGAIMENSIIDGCSFPGSTIKNLTAIRCTFIIKSENEMPCFDDCYFDKCRFIVPPDVKITDNPEITMVDCIVNSKKIKNKDEKD